MSKKTMLKHALVTAVTMAGIAYASRESEQIRNLTRSESGIGLFGWIRGLLPF